MKLRGDEKVWVCVGVLDWLGVVVGRMKWVRDGWREVMIEGLEGLVVVGWIEKEGCRGV